MSRALAVFHGHFGRATVYQLNRPFNVHAHREGHLIFHLGGTPGRVEVLEQPQSVREDTVVAVNPWEPHNFLPKDLADGALFLVLYVNAEWFAGVCGLRFGCTTFERTATLDRNVRQAAAMICGAPSLNGLDGELRSLIDECGAAIATLRRVGDLGPDESDQIDQLEHNDRALRNILGLAAGV